MEQEFLNRFYRTRRTVSLVELTNTRQRNKETVFDFINRWRHESLNCKDRLSEASGTEMCIPGMRWGLCYILLGIYPKTFEESGTRAHDMELSMSSVWTEVPPVHEIRKVKERQEFKKMGKYLPMIENNGIHELQYFSYEIHHKAGQYTERKIDFFWKRDESKAQFKGNATKGLLDSDVSAFFDELLEMKLLSC